MSPPSRPSARSTSRDLERYAALFAKRTRGMKSSAMRDMMAITARPEVISLAGGLPDTSTFPPATFAAAAARIAEESCAKALQYGPTDGLVETKSCIAEVMEAEGMRVDPEDMMVTTGGQQVLDLVAKTLIDPDDVIVAEGPSYPGALNAFKAYEADVVQIDMDAEGMRVDLMEEALDRLEREGRRPKFIYTVPSFQNPGGVTMSAARRRRLVEVAHERELLVLEDNPYGLLRYEGQAPEPLYAIDGGVFVMYLGTFSKIFSPGMRLGWVVAPPPVLEKIEFGKQEADLCTSTLSQLMVQAYFEMARLRGVAGRRLPRATRRHARGPGRALPAPGGVDAAGGRAVRVGDAARLHRHDRPPRAGAARQRGVRPRRGCVHGRSRPQRNAAELLGIERGPDP
jgi:2-aminoadipate transaminase